tara:strand:- start:715 stop:1890 length:1176 start_codon:yes stop_codon:yes gene_type:complete
MAAQRHRNRKKKGPIDQLAFMDKPAPDIKLATPEELKVKSEAKAIGFGLRPASGPEIERELRERAIRQERASIRLERKLDNPALFKKTKTSGGIPTYTSIQESKPSAKTLGHLSKKELIELSMLDLPKHIPSGKVPVKPTVRAALRESKGTSGILSDQEEEEFVRKKLKKEPAVKFDAKKYRKLQALSKEKLIDDLSKRRVWGYFGKKKFIPYPAGKKELAAAAVLEYSARQKRFGKVQHIGRKKDLPSHQWRRQATYLEGMYYNPRSASESRKQEYIITLPETREHESRHAAYFHSPQMEEINKVAVKLIELWKENPAFFKRENKFVEHFEGSYWPSQVPHEAIAEKVIDLGPIKKGQFPEGLKHIKQQYREALETKRHGPRRSWQGRKR